MSTPCTKTACRQAHSDAERIWRATGPRRPAGGRGGRREAGQCEPAGRCNRGVPRSRNVTTLGSGEVTRVRAAGQITGHLAQALAVLEPAPHHRLPQG
jgi:hypothetical protein